MNQVALIGRLTKDPVVRYTNSDLAIAEFTVAVDRPPTKNGDKQTDFPRCVAFGSTAELIQKHVGKGQKIGVAGSIQTGSYENKDGNTVYTTDVVVQKIDILEWKNDGNGTNGQSEQKSGSNQRFSTSWEQLDEDIPF